jgi:hypothetical protein
MERARRRDFRAGAGAACAENDRPHRRLHCRRLRLFASGELRRRYERCRIVVENSWQLGEWEKTPDVPGADPTALISASMKALAAPI